jgi:hypothetical protein
MIYSPFHSASVAGRNLPGRKRVNAHWPRSSPGTLGNPRDNRRAALASKVIKCARCREVIEAIGEAQ